MVNVIGLNPVFMKDNRYSWLRFSKKKTKQKNDTKDVTVMFHDFKCMSSLCICHLYVYEISIYFSLPKPNTGTAFSSDSAVGRGLGQSYKSSNLGRVFIFTCAMIFCADRQTWGLDQRPNKEKYGGEIWRAGLSRCGRSGGDQTGPNC